MQRTCSQWWTHTSRRVETYQRFWYNLGVRETLQLFYLKLCSFPPFTIPKVSSIFINSSFSWDPLHNFAVSQDATSCRRLTLWEAVEFEPLDPERPQQERHRWATPRHGFSNTHTHTQRASLCCRRSPTQKNRRLEKNGVVGVGVFAVKQPPFTDIGIKRSSAKYLTEVRSALASAAALRFVLMKATRYFGKQSLFTPTKRCE